MEFARGSYGYIAKKDIATAMDNVGMHPDAAGLYAQQAVEKMLKQYLKEVMNCSDESVLRSHKLPRLYRATNLKSLDDQMAALWEMTDAYFNTRYPGDEFFDMTVGQAKDFCYVARIVVKVIEGEIEAFRNKR
ncbi:MAG: HEPN domain-containing protein [Agathobaculum sp.]|uniref:HEPN domain-containing protein n=1 Tax=Agathobaculum sp. TaxID=2048138 RepID=UPI002A7F7F83|nr:HEPN domain-containing protein [Agathobaculum sp.]MDY3711813.1 HEPN domain-containing protein [Agathobaculum sp.]